MDELDEREKQWLLKEKHDDIESEAFWDNAKRLEGGEPLAYIIGYVPFLNTIIYLDSKPLIPRTETEFWVEKAIAEMKKCGDSVHVLDLGAGSGCIGVAVLKTLPDTHVDFVEVDEAHHPTILKNMKANNIDTARTRIIGGDLFENVSGAYDFILTNPPYVDPNLEGRLEKNVLEHEPNIALFGGQDGAEYVRRIIKDAPKYLNENGVLYIEHEPEQWEKIESLGKKADFKSIEIHKDQFQRERYTRLAI